MKINFFTPIFISLLIFASTVSGEDKKMLAKVAQTYSEIAKPFTCKSITAFALIKEMTKNKNIVLIDIRENKEQKISMLPNAITEEEFLKSPNIFKNKKIIAYCTIGHRSGKFAEKFKKLNIYNLEGGVLAWSHFKGRFYKDKKETNKVHVYSKEWNFLNSSYEAVFK